MKHEDAYNKNRFYVYGHDGNGEIFYLHRRMGWTQNFDQATLIPDLDDAQCVAQMMVARFKYVCIGKMICEVDPYWAALVIVNKESIESTTCALVKPQEKMQEAA